MNRPFVLVLSGVLVGLWPADALAQLPTNIAKIGGSNPVGAICDDHAQIASVPISVSTAGDTELVGLTTNQSIYICGFNFVGNGTVNVRLVYGTGTNCVTGQVGLTGLYPVVAQWGIAIPNTGFVQTQPIPVSNALCIELSASIGVFGYVTYVKRVPPS